MGVRNQFQDAIDLIAKELHFSISGEASEFRALLDRAGWRRFKLVIEILKLWQRPYHKGAEKYDRLMKLLALVTPDKTPGTKYRNTLTAYGKSLGEKLDADMRQAIDRDC